MLVLPAPVGRDALARALAEPHAVLVEAAGGGEPCAASDCAADSAVVAALEAEESWPLAAGARGVFLSLGTRTAYGIHLAALLADALVARGVIGADMRSGVELCLQEAIANAIIHGNLGISSASKDTTSGHCAFSQLVNERLNCPIHGQRRVMVHLVWDPVRLSIRVIDQGAGFDPDSVPPARPGGRARSGRGLMFMRALAAEIALELGGRCTTLTFQRDRNRRPEREGE